MFTLQHIDIYHNARANEVDAGTYTPEIKDYMDDQRLDGCYLYL